MKNTLDNPIGLPAYSYVDPKVTLFDILIAIAFVSPVAGGVTAGWRISLVGAAVGLLVGVLLTIPAIAGIWVMRSTAIRVTGRKQTTMATLLLVLIYLAMVAWAFMGMASASMVTSAIVHSRI